MPILVDSSKIFCEFLIPRYENDVAGLAIPLNSTISSRSADQPDFSDAVMPPSTVLTNSAYLRASYIGDEGEQATIDSLSRQCSFINRDCYFILLCALIPALMRFTQCIRRYQDSKKPFPHLVNAGKYATGLTNITVHFLLPYSLSSIEQNRFSNTWILVILSMANAIYTIYWDLVQDWGFFDPSPNVEHKFLREDLVYSRIWVYYFAIFQNVVLRCKWILEYYIVTTSPSILYDRKIFYMIRSIFCLLEIYRRFCWNFFRLENEHLNNCGEFRAVRDISIAPIKDDDIVKLEKMMDLDNGVVNRKNREKQEKTAERIRKKAALNNIDLKYTHNHHNKSPNKMAWRQKKEDTQNLVIPSKETLLKKSTTQTEMNFLGLFKDRLAKTKSFNKLAHRSSIDEKVILEQHKQNEIHEQFIAGHDHDENNNNSTPRSNFKTEAMRKISKYSDLVLTIGNENNSSSKDEEGKKSDTGVTIRIE